MTYHYAGNITESLTTIKWRVTAYNAVTGTFIDSIVSSNNTYVISNITNDKVTLVCQQAIDKSWQASLSLVINDLIIPSNSDITPYIFKCTSSGTTGTSEPIWDLVNPITDGTTTLELFDNLIDPITLGFKSYTSVDFTVEYLVVAGGGSGGDVSPGYPPGGGGAGGLLQGTGFVVSTGTPITVTVGAGGIDTSGYGNNGGDSVFSTLTATGGGGGAFGYPSGAGKNGGSGGSGASDGISGTGVSGQGYAGAPVGSGTGGGGGAGGVGVRNGYPGQGGAGISSSISGTSVTYATGGSGQGFKVGTANTGDGGSGGWYSVHNNGYAGGSGIVIIRYPDSFNTATTTGSPTYTNTGGFHIYKFLSSGTITF